MLLNTMQYLMFCLRECDSTVLKEEGPGVKGVGKSGGLVQGGCQKMWISI